MIYLCWAVLALWVVASVAGLVALAADFIAAREYEWDGEDEA